MDNDDLLRRMVIQRLMCNFELSISALELGYPIRVNQYFAKELGKLREFERDGLLAIEDDWISVTPKGRLLIRNICMVFDRHLAADRAAGTAPGQVHPLRFSRTI